MVVSHDSQVQEVKRMKKLALNKETLRKLDDATLDNIIGGRKETTHGWCELQTNCVVGCKIVP